MGYLLTILWRYYICVYPKVLFTQKHRNKTDASCQMFGFLSLAQLQKTFYQRPKNRDFFYKLLDTFNTTGESYKAIAGIRAHRPPEMSSLLRFSCTVNTYTTLGKQFQEWDVQRQLLGISLRCSWHHFYGSDVGWRWGGEGGQLSSRFLALPNSIVWLIVYSRIFQMLW